MKNVDHQLTMYYHFVWKHFNKLASSVLPVSGAAQKRPYSIKFSIEGFFFKTRSTKWQKEGLAKVISKIACMSSS